MITCYLMGGLGNQLFQIFCTISYAIQNKCDFIFPYSEKLTVGIERPTYWGSIFKRIHSKTTDTTCCPYKNEDLFKLPQVQEKRYFEYQELPARNYIHRDVDGLILVGYFQSLKYFNTHFERIAENIGLREWQMVTREKYCDLFTDDSGDSVSMHFRIGDYKVKQENHPVLSYEYYALALENLIKLIPNIKIVFYFCEKENNNEVAKMVGILQSKYRNLIFLKVDDNIPDWEQLLLMSCCSHNIIANSTFSLWAAYLNKNNEKVVCYPNYWLGPQMQDYNIRQLIPNSETKLIYPGTWVSL